MLRSILYYSIYFIKKGVIIFQPPSCLTQVHIDIVGRNQAGHRLASFCNQNVFFAERHLA